MAKRLHDVCGLPESEPLWRAGRGFVVRDLPWTVEKLRVIPPFEFENWAVIALGGIPNKVQVGDMGVPIVTLHRTPGLIHAIIRRVIFVDDDWWWRWCVWLNDNADAGADVRLIGEFPAQSAAEYPRNQNQGQPGEREKQINSPLCDDPIEKMEHGVKHGGRIQVHVISSGYALAITGSRVLDISENLVRIRSNSLNGGSSTCALRA